MVLHQFHQLNLASGDPSLIIDKKSGGGADMILMGVMNTLKESRGRILTVLGGFIWEGLKDALNRIPSEGEFDQTLDEVMEILDSMKWSRPKSAWTRYGGNPVIFPAKEAPF